MSNKYRAPKLSILKFYWHNKDVNKIVFIKINNKWHLVIKNAICYYKLI